MSGMAVEERDLLLRALVADKRLPAIVQLIEEHEREFIASGCAQSLAADANKQSHAWGSVFALRLLREDLLRLVNAQAPPKRVSGR